MRFFDTGLQALTLALSLSILTISGLSLAKQQQQTDDGYIGYSLQQHGDPESSRYETANTDTAAGVVLPIEPDVRLNASVSVQEISVEVDNITAKVNLDAQVLKLLRFSAGVDASIDRVKLSIVNISAKVELEARLGNIVQMVNDVLNSIDLNPIVATLGSSVNRIVDKTAETLGRPIDENGNPSQGGSCGGGSGGGAGEGGRGGGSGCGRGGRGGGGGGGGNQKRDLEYNVLHNILYSVNDYAGHTHRNRVLAQNGSMYDVYLDNDGGETGRVAVGLYSRDMAFTGHNRTLSIDGVAIEYEMQYLYQPYVGLDVVALIFMDASSGRVTRTKVMAEAEGGGGSTVSND